MLSGAPYRGIVTVTASALGARSRSAISRMLLGVVVLLLAAGCESRSFRLAHERGSVAAYLRYLQAYPKGAHRRRALEGLDDARFREAARADRPYGYRAYLQAQGRRARHADETRRRLAELSLERAKDPAALELVSERYGRTPQGREARRRLAVAEAKVALQSKDEGQAERYLARYPNAAAAGAVRELLGALRFRKLRPQTVEIEAFLQKFAGTSWAPKALERLRRLLIAEVETNRSPRTLESFAARFPEDGQLPRLRGLVRVRRVRWALSRLDLATLEKLAAARPSSQPVPSRRPKARKPPKPTLTQLIAECRRRAAACAELRSLARKALAWHPTLAPEQLQPRLQDADLQRVWQALAELGWRQETRAASLLYDALGEARASTVWAAAPALRGWLGRSPAVARARWVTLKLSRPPHLANPDEMQRWAYLALISGGAGERREGARLLRRLLDDKVRQLVAAHLLLMVQRRPDATLVPLLGAARRQVDRLAGAFPRQVAKEGVTAAALVEREIFALAQIVKHAQALRATSAGARLEQRIRMLLAQWRRDLKRADPSFSRARPVDLGPEARSHEAQRLQRLRDLVRRRGVLAGAVKRAVCARIASEVAVTPSAALGALRKTCAPLLAGPSEG